MTEQERMQAGALYSPKQGGIPDAELQVAIRRFNMSDYWAESAALDKLKSYFAKSDENTMLTPPFHCERGKMLSFGAYFSAGMGFVVQDRAAVTFGDHVSIGANVSIYTAVQPTDAMVRNMGFETARPVVIGSDVRIEGGCIICPGVQIGDDVVIMPGSVVAEDIPAHAVAGGNPCRVIRTITDEERDDWRKQLSAYMEDEDIRNQEIARDNMITFGSELTPEEKMRYDRMAASAEQLSIFDLM